MISSLRINLVVLMLLAAIAFVHGAVPGDLDGDKIISQDELSNAESQFKEGKITSDQFEEIKHIKENYPRTIVDCTNRTVTIYRPVKRIIVFGGYDTEIISMMGDEDKIVGVPNYLKDIDFRKVFFPILIQKPAPGSASSPDYEAILNLSPDLITCWHYYPAKLEEQLPDVIIRYASSKGPETGYVIDDPAQAKALKDSVMQRPELAETNAVKNGRVYVLYMALPLGIQGPIGEVYAAKIIQLDLFRDLDPQKAIEELLSNYLGEDFDASKHGVFVYPPV
ncbi:MAG TPA: ABC transporter substrate-binding protein [Methanothrix sp.]|nr:ABC transporter substrate-binding protein [Methanothrix sp.]